tara:strand:+ start:175 stop:282 length:108 start_codon:yes stop_codon:yes gene_type:complete
MNTALDGGKNIFIFIKQKKLKVFILHLLHQKDLQN